jgi:hypothetical protein
MKIHNNAPLDQVYCQSEAMLRYCGRLAGLYPEDPIAALEVDMILNTVEDMIQILSPSLLEKVCGQAVSDIVTFEARTAIQLSTYMLLRHSTSKELAVL